MRGTPVTVLKFFGPLYLLIFASIVMQCKTRTNQQNSTLMMIDKEITTGKSGESDEYLPENAVLAAFLWEDNFSDAIFFPAKVLASPSGGSSGDYEVEALAEARYVELGKKHVTKNVILQSHPAQKNEIKLDIIVFYCGEDTPYSKAQLAREKWNRGVVLNTDELYRFIIEIGNYSSLTEPVNRKYRVHLRNVRISDNPLIPGIEMEEK